MEKGWKKRVKKGWTQPTNWFPKGCELAGQAHVAVWSYVKTKQWNQPSQETRSRGYLYIGWGVEVTALQLCELEKEWKKGVNAANKWICKRYVNQHTWPKSRLMNLCGQWSKFDEYTWQGRKIDESNKLMKEGWDEGDNPGHCSTIPDYPGLSRTIQD